MSSLLSFLSFLSVIIIFGCNIKSQSLTQENSKIKETYHWPVGGERIITGSFAEFRARNFHMGTDFGTEGKIGVPILALTNGKLLKIQSYRYSIGNAILIKHDDGFISRYGHMNHFSDRILKSIKNPSVLRKIKYREDFELKIKSKDSIKISKGEVIGYSGKTGIGPPHLHVELIKDNIYYNVSDHLNLSGHESSIFIDEIKLVPEDNKTFINGKQKSFVIKTIRGQDGNYYPISSEFIKIQGKVSVQVSSHEATGRANRLGMKKISLFLNEKELQNFDLTAVYQPDTIRSCFIFDNYVSNIRGRPFKYYTHSRDDDSINNLLNKQKDTGIIDFKELKKDENNFIKISVFGLKYKKSNFVFMVRPDFQKYNFPEIIEPFYNLFKGKELDLITKDKKFSVKFFGDSVFSKAYVSVLENKSINISTEGIKQVSPIYSVKPDLREFNKGYEVELRLDKNRQINLSKSGLYLVSDKGEILAYYFYARFNKKSNSYKIKIKNTGNFVVLEDHSPPTIKAANIINRARIKSGYKILLKATDIGSGVGGNSIKATVDGKKVFLDYDPDLRTWEIFLPESVYSKKQHYLEAYAIDRARNKSETIKLSYTVQ